ncbi:universal stress protein [uncultured Methanobrevibacter sp.]|uniref:universal stress protein n=1 Tax=uncultured Methanobrevibacter sp. TaxID=253161 RepID=UPI0025E97F11|nr:universal stress protein [uncultured Methanobrevibacter sp.]
MINKILIASDGSSSADKAADLAINIASKYNAKLAALYIFDPMEMSYDDGDDEGGAVLDKITSKGNEYNVTVIEHIISANPISDFKVMISKINPDLIVIASHGKTYDEKPYNDSQLGSVALKVLEVSNVPVIISK